jgi:hypothetical protein
MTRWIAVAVTSACMEVGRNCHRFHRRIAEDLVRI